MADHRVGNGDAGDRRGRVALGGDDDRCREGRGLGPQGLPRFAAGGGGHHCEHVAVEQREEHLGFGITEAAVVFDQAGTVGRQHDAGVDDPDVGGSLGRHTLRGPDEEGVDEFGDEAGVEAGHRVRTPPCRRC